MTDEQIADMIHDAVMEMRADFNEKIARLQKMIEELQQKK